MALNPSAIQFNGTTNLVKLDSRASIKNMGSFTCMAWFQANDSVRDPLKKMWVERQGSGSKIRFSMTPYLNKFRVEFSPKDGVTDTNYDAAFPQWNDQRWHHGAFVASLGGANPTYKIVIDGATVASGKLVLPAGVTTVENTAPLGVYLGNASFHTSGGETFATDRFWQGNIDDILIFNTALSESAILDYVQSHDFWPSTDTAIFSNYRFIENTGSTADDDDNPGWLATMYNWNSGSSTLSTTTSMWIKNRPFLGNGTADTTVPTAPTAPSATGATSDGFTFTFTGNRINDDNIFVHHWEVQLSLSNTFSSVVRTDTILDGPKSVTYTGLLPNTNYYTRVRAVDEAGNTSTWTTTATIATLVQGNVTPPDPPTGLVATNITHNSFQLGFVDATGHAGYKLDVSPTSTFSTFLTGYQNRDLGDVTSHVVTGTAALTNYYVRMRTYDSADNESLNSVVLLVQTAPPPDVAPPTQVVVDEASSIASTAWTMNWSEAEDDVGVVSYEIDVATDSGFTLPLMYGATPVLAYNVGNILSYRVVGAQPNTTYFMRARAKDASGKVSTNSDTVTVTTLDLSVEDGGLLSVDLLATHAYGVTSASPTTRSTTLTVAGSGSASTEETFLRFDLTAVTGTVSSAVLNFEATGSVGTGFTINATAVVNSSFNMDTITWNTRPTVGGTVFSADAFASVSIDLSGSIVSRNVFLVKLTATESGTITLTNPTLTVETDPISATMTAGVDNTMTSGVAITNYLKNPSFEVAPYTTTWAAFGAGVTLTSVTDPYRGSRALEVVTNGGAAFQGINLTTAEFVPASTGQTWTFSVAMRYISGTQRTVTMQIAQYDAGSVQVASSTKVVTLNAGYHRYAHTATLGHASTVKIVCRVYTGSTAVAMTWRMDAAMLELAPRMSAYVDGTQSGATWTGTAHESISQLQASSIVAESFYIGDNNASNTAVLKYRPTFRSNSILVPGTTVNRSTKTWTGTVGPSSGSYNLIRNPSAEVDVAGWILSGSGTVLVRSTDYYSTSGTASVSTTVGVLYGGNYSPEFAVSPSSPISFSADVLAPVGMTLRIALRSFDATGTLLSTSPATLGTEKVGGDGQWHTIYGTANTHASAAYARISVFAEEPFLAGTFYTDRIFAAEGSFVPMYVDGDEQDAVWDGNPHASSSSLIVKPQSSYDIIWTYSDADGIVGVSGGQTLDVGETVITPAVPDNATSIQNVVYTPDYTKIDLAITYSGDDDEDMSVVVNYTRADLSTWSIAPAVINRVTKTIQSSIEGLQSGTSYTIRAVVTDADGVSNPTDGIIQQNVSTTSTFGVAEGTSSVQFNGVELMGGAAGHIGVIEHNAFDFPRRRLDIKDQPRRHGAVKISDYWGEKEITLRGVVSGYTRGELAQHIDLLKRTFASESGLLTVDTLTNQHRYYHATCQSFEAPENAEEHFRHLEWEATFICADPFAYDRDSVRITNNGVTNGNTVTLENSGDIDANLQLTLTTTHSYPVAVTLINDTTGEMIRPTSTIVAGDVLIMDTSFFSLTRNGLETTYTGSFMHLSPGENSIRILLSSDYTVITPSVNTVAVWQNRYI